MGLIMYLEEAWHVIEYAWVHEAALLIVLIVFIVYLATVTAFLDSVCCSASRYWDILLVSTVGMS
jgi:hypothetical protein